MALTAGDAADLVAEGTYLTCEEIQDLVFFFSWMEYLLMIRYNRSEYLYALVCAPCLYLKILVQEFNYNHLLILPEDPSWVEALFYAARLIQCDIPY